MVHSKSISWNNAETDDESGSSARAMSVNKPMPGPSPASSGRLYKRPTNLNSSKRCSIHGVLEISTSENKPRLRRGLSHKPSLSESSFQPSWSASSPGNNRFRPNTNSNASSNTPAVDNFSTTTFTDFKFPRSNDTSPLFSDMSSPYSTDLDDALTNITSPGSDTAIIFENIPASPFLVNPQPNLQEIFISLAQKERRVLEAREQLMNAETELVDFKRKWNKTLKNGQSDSFSGRPLSPDVTSEYLILEREAYLRRNDHRGIRRRRVSSSRSNGLGIYQMPYEPIQEADRRLSTLYNSKADQIDSSDAASTFSSASSLASSDDDSEGLLTSRSPGQQPTSHSDSTAIAALLDYIASLGSLILQELGTLLMYGSSEDERQANAVQPRFPSVIESYYGVESRAMLGHMGPRRL